ncbi:PREDICTED: uncharacterized protein LOC109326579 isoform X2 [Lupinus angustifolius]|uniref:uncharacterized protein LOC109326579 isoform X2 n=1 Tax=Lupinus angustifolius TaxID=3871 RepID=UPI00092E8358|nr:PREDICTED: uncharacterized protein LOC109326579 isoform X2 [Lupinus angustifolius]
MMEREPQTQLSNEKEGDKRKHNHTKRRRINKKLSASSSSSSASGFKDKEKSKKENVRSLSAVAEALSTFQMSSYNKLSKNCNGVDHASVPPMKKRSHESTLTDSVKVKGIESAEKDGIKKSKKPCWSTSQAVCGAITKDEQEVAETLFSLAGMFPHNASDASKTELECQSLPEESANASFEGATQDACPCPERSPEGAAKITSLNETVGQQQNDFSESAKLLMASHSTDKKKATSVLVNSSKVALHDSELYLAMGLNVPRQALNSQIGKQPDMELETVGIDSKPEQHVIKDQKENEGPALWPGLSSRASSGTNAPYLRSSAAKAPDWLNAAICASKQDVMESPSSGTIPEVVTHTKSWKSCAAHVHISHLIQSLEVSKGQVKNEANVYKLHQTRVQQGSKCGDLKEVDNLNGMRNGTTSAAGTVHSSTMRSSNEAKNSTLQKQCYYNDISQAPPTPRVYGPHNESFNFLSLSSGANGLKVNDNFNKGGSRLEPLSKYQVPNFQTLQQQHGLMPMPRPQSQYASTSYHDEHPFAGPQVRLQQPHYYGSSPLSGTHYSSTISNKQHQSFWTVQPATPQGRSADFQLRDSQYHNWQSGWHGSSALSSRAQVIVPHSPEALGSKITSISEQQLFALASSLPPSRTTGLNIHLPSVCEESRGRFHSSGTPSLQLLCDERI